MREKEEDFNVDFLDPERVKATEEKVKSGKILMALQRFIKKVI